MCKIFQTCHKNCRLQNFIAKAAIFKMSVFGDFYAFKVCHEIVHVSLCPLGFPVMSLSPFIKWLWPNDCFCSYTNWLKPSAKAKYIDLDRKSEFSKQNGQSPPDPSWCQEISQMQTMQWLFFQQTFQVENPHDGSQQKETFCFCTVQLLF